MDELNPKEQRIKEEAEAWARANKKRIAKSIVANFSDGFTEPDHVAIFMSGSPAAGKTEVARSLAEIVGGGESSVVRLDPDDYREMIPGYQGALSYCYQGASSIILDAAFDLLTKNKQTFIFDSTLSDFKRASKNIQRCLDKDYTVKILFVFQDAMTAWRTAQKREIDEGRMVPMDSFIDRYFGSKKTVVELKEKFTKKIEIDLLLKDIETGRRSFEFNVSSIDSYIPEKYTRTSLKAEILKQST